VPRKVHTGLTVVIPFRIEVKDALRLDKLVKRRKKQAVASQGEEASVYVNRNVLICEALRKFLDEQS